MHILFAVRQQLRPLFDQVVIKELEPDRVRNSGLLLPPGEHQTPPQHGIVLAVGPGLDWWSSVGLKMPVVPGDQLTLEASVNRVMRGIWCFSARALVGEQEVVSAEIMLALESGA